MENFSQILRRSYQEVPDSVALHLLYTGSRPDQSLSYRALILGAAGYASALSTAGVKPGEVVVLILNHGPDLIFSFLGAVLHGSVPAIMPFLTEKLSPEHYRASLVALFAVTAPAAIVVAPEFEADVRDACAASNLPISTLVSTQVPLYSPDSHGKVPIDNPSEIDGAEIDFAHFPGLHRSPDEIVLLQHSSGSTGLQKGVALSHRAVFNQLESYARALHLDADQDVIVSWLPLYHDMGLIAGFLLPVLCRVPLVLLSPFDWVRAPYRLFQAVSRYRGTLTWLPNFAYNFCAMKIRDRDLDGVELSTWRAVINCSEPMHWDSHRMFLERFHSYGLRTGALATCYAMAENVFAVTQGGVSTPVTVDEIDSQTLLSGQAAIPARSGQISVKMLSAGRPIDGVELKILDSQGQALSGRHVGEIALRSHCMLEGYYHRPDLTGQAFLDGWFLTGDLGYLADGELYITGRKKDILIVGGKNIYPQDLERLAGEVEGVHPGRVVAFGIPNVELGTEEVVLLAESDEVVPERCAEIAARVRRQITQGSDIALRYVEVVDRNWLIKTSSGKVARSANRDRWLRSREIGDKG